MSAGIEDRLAVLATMSRAQLSLEWERVLGTDVPVNFGNSVMARAIAHRMQERVFGEMQVRHRRELRRLVGRDDDSVSLSNGQLPPGSRLAREWHGRVHEVIVLGDGYAFEDRKYTSLTAIAREITGARWSGPRFFGLTGKRAK